MSPLDPLDPEVLADAIINRIVAQVAAGTAVDKHRWEPPRHRGPGCLLCNAAPNAPIHQNIEKGWTDEERTNHHRRAAAVASRPGAASASRAPSLDVLRRGSRLARLLRLPRRRRRR